MKLVQFDDNGSRRVGILTEPGSVAPLTGCTSVLEIIQAMAPRAAQGDWQLPAQFQASPATKVTRLLAPLTNPPKMLCVAANYRAHIEECGITAPDRSGTIIPQFFAKFPSTCIIGPEAPIPLLARNVALDWEVEIAVIIGCGGRDIAVKEARRHIFGYSILNDVSERKINAAMPSRQARANDEFFDWLTGKWFDGAAPFGPALVTADEIPDPQNLALRLFLNEEKMQDSNTSLMITPIDELISYISRILRLEPGDVIATGTPEGTGVSRGRFLRPGDRVRCWIEGLGTLENPVVLEDAVRSTIA